MDPTGYTHALRGSASLPGAAGRGMGGGPQHEGSFPRTLDILVLDVGVTQSVEAKSVPPETYDTRPDRWRSPSAPVCEMSDTDVPVRLRGIEPETRHSVAAGDR